jgi:2-methylcitrate dehydratase PrpD
MDPTYDIAQHLIDTTYEDIPTKAAEMAKMQVLDSLGVALAGSPRPGVQKLIEVLRGFGGKEQSSVVASGIKLPVLDAAQVNTMMMYTLDWDDTTDYAIIHPGCVVVPACFAVAEYKGKVSGKECITAVALGTDLMTRLALAAKYDEVERTMAGWHYTVLYGHMTSAAISGKILGFDKDKMVSALGLGYQQSSGSLQFTCDGGDNKGPDFATRGGILAALMAGNSIVGPKNCIEGNFGMYNLYHRGGYDREALLGNLGKNYHGVGLTIKPYPSCRITHAFIDAALALVNEHDIQPDQIVEIVVVGNAGGYSLCVPIEEKRSPSDPVASQFSVPWSVAAATVRRKAAISEFSAEAIKDESILAMAKKIKAEEDPDMAGGLPGRVTIVTNEGVYTKQVDHPSGGPQNPMSFTDCANKFRDCASYSVKPLAQGTIEHIIRHIEKLEEVDDIAEIIKEIS